MSHEQVITPPEIEKWEPDFKLRPHHLFNPTIRGILTDTSSRPTLKDILYLAKFPFYVSFARGDSGIPPRCVWSNWFSGEVERPQK